MLSPEQERAAMRTGALDTLGLMAIVATAVVTFVLLLPSLGAILLTGFVVAPYLYERILPRLLWGLLAAAITFGLLWWHRRPRRSST